MNGESLLNDSPFYYAVGSVYGCHSINAVFIYS